MTWVEHIACHGLRFSLFLLYHNDFMMMQAIIRLPLIGSNPWKSQNNDESHQLLLIFITILPGPRLEAKAVSRITAASILLFPVAMIIALNDKKTGWRKILSPGFGWILFSLLYGVIAPEALIVYVVLPLPWTDVSESPAIEPVATVRVTPVDCV
jgi:hypothetical protein